ncbi:hypothetical protein EYF80_024752 [Liparis tanakae]|uniref:Uncharacterized protein n=1 Tax=Liparis tanakae TaxID=230148 RepID=A0A4Z2HJ93_9TELE|nr:hypothetical protein EYF80_024752 [Liparis tanakae]
MDSRQLAVSAGKQECYSNLVLRESMETKRWWRKSRKSQEIGEQHLNFRRLWFATFSSPRLIAFISWSWRVSACCDSLIHTRPTGLPAYVFCLIGPQGLIDGALLSGSSRSAPWARSIACNRFSL